MTDFDTATSSAADAFAGLLADLPPKSRIHEVAKRFGVSSRLLIDALGEGGITAKSSSSSVDATAARTALVVLRDSGRLVVGPAAPTADVEPTAGTATDADAAGQDAPLAEVGAPAVPPPVAEPAPWAPLFTEPPAATAVTEPAASAAPAKPARRRASRPAAAPDVPTAVVTTAVVRPTAPAAVAPAVTSAPPVTTAAGSVDVDEVTGGDDEQYADLPARMRVHELAKRVGISAKTLIALLTDQGVVAKSANSVLARAVAVDLLKSMSAQSDDEQAALVGGAATDTDTDTDDDGRRSRRRRGRRGRNRTDDHPQDSADDDDSDDEDSADAAGRTAPTGGSDGAATTVAATDDDDDDDDGDAGDGIAETDQADGPPSRSGRRRRRRGGRGSERGAQESSGDDADGAGSSPAGSTTDDAPDSTESDGDDENDSDGTGSSSSRRRRRRRRSGPDDAGRPDDPADTVVHVRDAGQTRSAESEVQGVRGSTRLEAKRQRRRDSLQTRRRPQILTEAEFLARRESVHRVMAVRQRADLTQVAVLEDNVLVEHFVSRAGSASMIGNVYLGRVQNVLPSMEAAFVDIGRGRNAVLYAGEVNWEAAGLAGKSRRIESALSSGDTVLVQVSKDPVGHKGARLTTQISLPGRFLVYVPAGGATGISRKLPDTERKRLKSILDRIVPDDAGVIIRTAAEGVSEEELARDVERLKTQWQQISAAAAKQTQGAQARQLYSEPDTLIKVIRDLFNSDISELVIDGDDSEHGIWESLSSYVEAVAPELAPRLHRFDGATDVFAAHRIDEQIAKALERKVFLPSGGSLVIDRTEAMTVVDVNTGKFTGSGGNLEQTVTKNNLEAAE
ncbi:MAG: translation initiation factor IF-2 N-terminal domain-containing protein, partial [Nakamurella sp.]